MFPLFAANGPLQSSKMHPLTEEYLRSFVPQRFHSDERYRMGHINILAPKIGTRILGMHTPEMKKLAKELVRSGNWRKQLDIWSQHEPLTGASGLTHEERMIWGLVIDYVKVPLQERLQLLDGFIPAIDNWAICDNLCCNSKWIEKEDKQEIWLFLRTLIFSPDEFRSRVGLVLSLSHYLSESDVVRTLDTVILRQYNDSDPYYVRMGVAWLFAEALCKQYELALPYIQNASLSRWIHNKAIQKARESYRITPEQKAYLQSLKIR